MAIIPPKLQALPACDIATMLTADGKLPYVRRPEYLSPTSFFELEDNPDLFYLKRCGPEEYKPPREPQANYFGVGSAFDYFVKVLLAAKLGQLLPIDMYEDQVEAHNRVANSMIPRLGMAAAAAYFDSPCWTRLFNEGLHKIEDQVDPVIIEGVPIWGKPDASFWHEDYGIAPLDFKTTGAFSKAKKRPQPGFNEWWQREGGSWKELGPHRDSYKPLQDVNEKWAIQCVMYGWMLGRPATTPMPAGIDQVVFNGADISIARFRRVISVEFQQELLGRCQAGWERVVNDMVVDGPDPTWTMMMA